MNFSEKIDQFQFHTFDKKNVPIKASVKAGLRGPYSDSSFKSCNLQL